MFIRSIDNGGYRGYNFLMKEYEFKDVLRSILKEFNLTQTAFASMIGAKQSQVSEWLKGKAKPGYDNIKAILLNFDVPAEFLLGIKVL